MGYVGGVQRPHVALDDVLFLVGQLKHGFGVVACDTSMLEAVPMGDVTAIMPVVQVKIVQERLPLPDWPHPRGRADGC